MTYEVSQFLSRRQQETYSHLQPGLKRRMDAEMKMGRTQIVRNVLDVIRGCPQSEMNYIPFFTTFFQKSDTDDLSFSATILDITKRGYGERLFAFSSTKKREYHSKETLLKITHLFHQWVLQNDPRLTDLPPYEEGGANIPHTPQIVLQQPQTNKVIEDIEEKNCFSQYCYLVKQSIANFPDEKRSCLRKLMNQITEHPLFCFSDYIKIEVLKLVILSFLQSSSRYDFHEVEEFIHVLDRLKKRSGEEILFQIATAKGFVSPFIFQDVVMSFTHLVEVEDQRVDYQAIDDFSNGIIDHRTFQTKLINSLSIPSLPVNPDDPGIDALINRLDKDPSVKQKLPDEDLRRVKSMIDAIEKRCLELASLPLMELVKRGKEIRQKGSFKEEDIIQLAAIGRLAIFHIEGKYLYSTQLFAVVGMLIGNQSTLAQVKTGEGKSLICTLLAFVLGMQNRAVDVISSSPYLSKRDAEKFKSFFAQFGLIAKHICHEKLEPEHFNAHILYGTASDFEFAIMREKLWFHRFFERRPVKCFDCVIVDEVDNLTIDTQLNTARLSIPAPFSYEWVYTPLYKALEKNPQLTIGELREILITWENSKYQPLVANIDDEQLEQWKTSALRAQELKVKDDYVIELEKRGGEKQPTIVIVDKNNCGRLQWGCRWSGGLHEFVEVKHVAVQKESLTPLAMSHAVFYQRYSSLFGLTGTLGSQVERKQISSIYGVRLFDVPPFRPCIRKDTDPKIYARDETYLQAIYEEVQEKIALKRPVLVICSNIKDSEKISDYLKSKGVSNQVYNELQEENEETIIRLAGQPGKVTVATNNAGRGTDIILTSESIKNGGLHVVVTFYPDSLRVEEQAIGRAGRQGQPGSSSIFMKGHDLPFFDMLTGNLGIHRQLLETHRAKIYQERAEMERSSHPMTESFYKQIQDFKESIFPCNFSRLYADQLAKSFLPFSKKSPVAKHLEDSLIQEEIVSLLSLQKFDEESLANKRTRWEALLTRIGKRIINRAIEDWSIYYYPKMEAIHAEASLGIKDKQDKVTELLNRIKVKWERYLLSPAKGIALYVEELTGARLYKIFSEDPVV